MPILFSLCGATGVGKTEISLALAEQFNAQIIGVDSRQIYKGFIIGTAQPSLEIQNRCPHHLVNFCPPTKKYSAGEFCSVVKKILKENPKQNFILVGGTGLYLQALMLGLPDIPMIAPEIREELENLYQSKGLSFLYKQAIEIDADAVKFVDKNNKHRIMRILEVYEGTHQKLSTLQKQRIGGIGDIPVVFLNRERPNLYARINERVKEMIKNGWIEEIQELSKIVPIDAPAWQSLGYLELLKAKNHAEIQDALEEVKKKTRNYAKRQITWFLGQTNPIIIDLDECKSPLGEISNKLANCV